MLLFVVILKISRWLKKYDGKWQLSILTKDALCYNYYIAYYHIIIIFFSHKNKITALNSKKRKIETFSDRNFDAKALYDFPFQTFSF